jgi:cytochrome c oxidase subunit IV
MSTTSRRAYRNVFLALVVLTAAELGLVYVPRIPHGGLVAGLVLLALGKAALVALFFMHLASETRALKLTVILPFLLPAAFAVALMGDAIWRIAP